MRALQNFIYRNQLKYIRHLRLFRWIYNLLNYGKLSYLKPLYQQAGLKRSPLAPLDYAKLKHLNSMPSWLELQASSEALTDHPTFLTLSTEHQEEVKKWSRQGYVYLKGFFDHEAIDRVAAVTEKLWASTDGDWRFGDRKVLLAFENQELWAFLNQEKLKALISMLMGHEALLLNSIHFLRGDEQPMHSDSFYMSTFPKGRLIGSWTALEDIHPDAGPLRYIPGSHTLPYVTNCEIDNLGNFWRTGIDGDETYIEKVKEIIQENNLEPQFHLPKKGDLLLWHANLLHGGSKRKDVSRTRKSMVGHYVAKDVICFHENTQRPAFRKKPVFDA